MRLFKNLVIVFILGALSSNIPIININSDHACRDGF